jgi:hypothetical protein
MMKHLIFCILALAGMHSACSQSSNTEGAQQAADGQPAAASSAFVHFFSVAWGCVEVDKTKLDAAAYTIQDFETKSGACPETLPVLDTSSKQLLKCPIAIGPKSIPATYILFDKRTLDGKTVRDLRAEGFTADNFCPAVAERTFN